MRRKCHVVVLNAPNRRLFGWGGAAWQTFVVRFFAQLFWLPGGGVPSFPVHVCCLDWLCLFANVANWVLHHAAFLPSHRAP